MKAAIFIITCFFLASCASSKISNYRFADDTRLYSFEVKHSAGVLADDLILFIDSVPQDTIKNLSAINTTVEKLSVWKNKPVKFSGSLNTFTGNVSYRVLVNNELVSEK